jgi:hypothetical protein
MASPDLKDSYNQASSKIDAVSTYNQVASDKDNLLKTLGNKSENSKEKIVDQIIAAKQKAENFKKKVQSEVDNQMELIKQLILKAKSSALDKSNVPTETVTLLKDKFIKIAYKAKPVFKEILVEEIVNLVGCNQQQQYAEGQVIYVSIPDIDLFKSLKLKPTENAGKLFYEINTFQPSVFPSSINRLIKDKIDNSTSTLLVGKSGQNLFDIQYSAVGTVTTIGTDGTITTNNNVVGDFLKITMKARVGGITPTIINNGIQDFLFDYYGSMSPIDTNNMVGRLIDALTGAVSMEINSGTAQIDDTTKFGRFIQRILGFCQAPSEIDVQGTAKVSELGEINSDFFELDDLDLRALQERSQNIFNKVITFKDCNNVELPVDSNSIINELVRITEVDLENENALISALDDIVKNKKWSLLFPYPQIKVSFDDDIFKKIPIAIAGAILSPKVILGVLVSLQLVGQSITNTISDVQEFFKKLSKFIYNVISRIAAYFVKQLVEELKKNIFFLVQRITRDVQSKSQDVQTIMILKLIQVLIVGVTFVQDYRQCKSVIDEILKFLSIFGVPLNIPLPLLNACALLEGYNSTRAFSNTIEEMQAIGIPTGPMPDGSPNMGLQALQGVLNAQQKESAENSKAQIALPEIPGITPSIKLFGKSM